MKASVARPLRRPNLLNAGRITDVMLQDHHTVRQSKTIVRPVTASKSRACREGHTSGPCRWLFSAARPVGDVKSLKALHRYNVVKAPAVGVITVWKWPAAFLEGHTSGPCPSLFLAARVRSEFSAAPRSAPDDHERNCAARFSSRSRLLLRRQMRGVPRPSARPAFLRLPPPERLDVAARRNRRHAD